MKNVNSAIKLNRLKKTRAVSVFILFLGIAGSAFKRSDNNGDLQKPNRDSLRTDKSGFKSLFASSNYDPSKPYVVQLNPRAVTFVQNYIQTEGSELERMKIWGKPYLDMFNQILEQHGLPSELKYLSVIESSLLSHAVSYAGAAGPWQIMPAEAERMGLKINSRSDERTDYFKSTHAAARILKGLYSQFNDWLLVVAAYNCGAGRLRKAMKLSGSRNFWDLQYYLPLETRNHVKRFIGTHYVFEGNGGLTTMTASEIKDYDNDVVFSKKQVTAEEGTDIIEVAGKFKSGIIAKVIDVNAALFNRMNPGFDKVIGTGKKYLMRLPKGKSALFLEKKNDILYSSIQAYLNYQ